MNQEEKKRVFFGFEAIAPWPDKFPVGRLLDEHHRHMTIAFLGSVSCSGLQNILELLPKPKHLVGLSGLFDNCVFLPPKHINTASWHVQLIEADFEKLKLFHETFSQALIDLDLLQKKPIRPLLPHVTIARTPFDPKQWKKHFTPLPMYLKDFHLFESVGDLKYPSLWKKVIKAPFVEIEHTADIAYRVHAENVQQLFKNAITALSFRFPPLIQYMPSNQQMDNLDDIVIGLNEIITRADSEQHLPFKAVSFHGEIQEEQDHTLTWEMIVDV